MSKRKDESTAEDESPPAKIPPTASPQSFDFFEEHFCRNLPELFVEELTLKGLKSTKKINLRTIGDGYVAHFMDNNIELHWDRQSTSSLSYEEACVNKRLLKTLNSPDYKRNQYDAELFGIIGRYISMLCVSKNLDYTNVYCAHILNHILRTRNIIIANQKKIDAAGDNITDDLIEATRDQGFNRPKVLILTPFKKFAHKIVNTMVDILLPNERNYLMNGSKFEEEYGDNGVVFNEKWRASPEFKELMSGNIDDSFRIGLSLGKKAIKLYTAFENSDIIISSPLGLRMIIGDQEEEVERREFDFLSSVEIVIIDKANILLMQNWEHLLNIMETVNAMPTNVTSDISRVRHWLLQGHGSVYRQTLAFSDTNFAELQALFAQYDKNFAGLLSLTIAPKSRLSEIEIPIVQELHRFDCDDPEKQADLRFDYFVRVILPKLRMGTLIFISSYFDYIRVRNYLNKEDESFAQIHEYASDGKIKKSRKAFATHQKKLLLMTERCHFFRHFVVRGVKSVVFYQMPVNPAFYADIINMAKDESKVHSRLIYSKMDVLRLQNVFGPKYAKELLQSEKKFHALVSE